MQNLKLHCTGILLFNPSTEYFRGIIILRSCHTKLDKILKSQVLKDSGGTKRDVENTPKCTGLNCILAP